MLLSDKHNTKGDKMNKMTWTIEDHLCRSCGGRILRSATGAGMTPGGNPIYKCTICGKSKASMSPDELCYCGLSFKNQHLTEYRCLPFSIIEEYPKMKDAFLACGCDPTRGEVGIVLKKNMYEAMGK